MSTDVETTTPEALRLVLAETLIRAAVRRLDQDGSEGDEELRCLIEDLYGWLGDEALED